MNLSFADQVALVMGASFGMGHAIVVDGGTSA